MTDRPVTVSIELELIELLLMFAEQCAEDLQCELRKRYTENDLSDPSMQRRFERDMDVAETVKHYIEAIKCDIPAPVKNCKIKSLEAKIG